MGIRSTLIIACLGLIGGCAGTGASHPVAARSTTACPAGTIKYCEGLFETPGTGLRGCGCAELIGRR